MNISQVLRLGGVGLCCILVPAALAKDSKPLVPAYVLQAHTVAVMVDPSAGISFDDPNANQTAQRDVEKAIANWGRLTLVMAPQQADLVIVLRKGHGKIADATITDPRQNGRAGSATPMDDGMSVGAQHGSQPGLADGTRDGAGGAHPQIEASDSGEDSFEVFKGNTEHAMDSPVAWRWVRQDGLRSHNVPAVAEFRKAIEDAEKQAAKNKHP